jgi:hypothetical protein
MMETVGGFRIRRELELVLEERQPQKALARAHELGVLARVHPSLVIDKAILDKIRLAAKRDAGADNLLAILTSRLNDLELKQLARYLRFKPDQLRAINETRTKTE